MVPATLFVAINMVDRFISMGAILVEKVQLVGGICLLVASKYREICTHGIDMMLYFSTKTSTTDSNAQSRSISSRFIESNTV